MQQRSEKWLFLTLFIFACYQQSALANTNLYLEVVINGRNTDRIVEFTHEGDEWTLRYDDFIALGLQSEQTGKQLVSLTKIPGTHIVYDAELQRLLLTVPSQLLPTQYFSAHMPHPISGAPRRDTGSFINYNLVSVSGNMMSDMESLWHEYHFFSTDFIAVSNGIYQNNADAMIASGYTRFETYYQRDNETDLSELTIGDVINATPNWGRSVRMGGLRFARNYDLDPTLITYPLPEFYGEYALPGSIDLIINDQVRWREPVGSGPFLINMAPYMSGAGVAQVLTTNAQGQQVQAPVNFISRANYWHLKCLTTILPLVFVANHLG